MPNQALAQRMLFNIERNRQAFRMSDWFTADDGPHGSMDPDDFVIALDENENPPCGTTMCLAGWAAVCSGYVLKQQDVGVSPNFVFGVFANKDSNEALFPEANWQTGEPSTNYTNFVKMGATLLGIDLQFAEVLFGVTNTQAEHILRLLAAGTEFDWQHELEIDDDDEDWYEEEDGY